MRIQLACCLLAVLFYSYVIQRTHLVKLAKFISKLLQVGNKWSWQSTFKPWHDSSSKLQLHHIFDMMRVREHIYRLNFGYGIFFVKQT